MNINVSEGSPVRRNGRFVHQDFHHIREAGRVHLLLHAATNRTFGFANLDTPSKIGEVQLVSVNTFR